MLDYTPPPALSGVDRHRSNGNWNRDDLCHLAVPLSASRLITRTPSRGSLFAGATNPSRRSRKASGSPGGSVPCSGKQLRKKRKLPTTISRHLARLSSTFIRRSSLRKPSAACPERELLRT